MNITKRDGRIVEFDSNKIKSAVLSAFKDVDGELSDYAYDKAEDIANHIAKISKTKELSVEEVQDLVEKDLMATKRKDVAKSYIIYRENRTKVRKLKEILPEKNRQLNELINGTDEVSKKENSNKDTRIIPTMRDYIAGFTCKDVAPLYIPKYILELHKLGAIHFHDLDYSPAMPMHNCELINLEDMLQNGTVISKTMIEKPKSFRTACTITTQISAQVASSSYGGQSINVAHLAPFIEESRKRYIKKFPFLTDEEIDEMVNDEISDGIQTIQYQLITMSSTNGQAPFCTLFLYLGDAKSKQEEKDLAKIIEEILKQRIEGVKNPQGVSITTAFPKLIYVLDENNIHEDSEYYYLTELAAECSAKRLVPDYISAKVMRKIKGDVYSSMGCRSFLASDPVNHKYWGKFNKGVVTINLADAALTAINEQKDFWEVLDERLEVCHQGLLIRYHRLQGTKSDVAPILWQHGAIARLKSGETIDELLKGDYSSISLGYSGLWETVLAITGKTLVDKEGLEFGQKVMQHLNDKCTEWNSIDNIGFSPYGTPMENTTEKFAKALKRFPIIKGVNDKKYLVNSYHIDPAYKIDAFTKLDIEGQLSPLSGGGFQYNLDGFLEIA